MKVFSLSPLLLLASANAFSTQPLATARSSSALGAYVPDGFTAESYKKFKEDEERKKKANLGRLGPRGFESRSMQSFQEALERGEVSSLICFQEKWSCLGISPWTHSLRTFHIIPPFCSIPKAAHLMPVFNAKEKIARGEIRKEDVPYMQRGGKW